MLLEARLVGASAKREFDNSGSRSWGGAWWPAMWIALVLYASLLPFNVHLERAGQVWPSWAETSPADIRTNILVYLPVGAGLAHFYRRRSMGTVGATALSFVLGTLLSVSVEFLQTLLPSRVSSWLDVALNAAGTLLGAIAAIIVARFFRGMVRQARREVAQSPFRLAASLLAIGLFVYQIIPCDFVTDTAQMHAAFARSRLNPASIPPGTASEGLAEFSHELTAASWFLLLGGLLGLGGVEAGRRSFVAFGSAVKQGLVLATVIELVQLFTQSHVAETNSVVMRSIAVSMGAWCGVFLLSETLGTRSPGRLPRAAWMPIVGALVFWQMTLLTLPGLNWFLGKSANWEGIRLAGLPFESLWRASGLNGPLQALGTLLTYLTLAASLRILLNNRSTGLAGVAIVTATTGAAVVAEMIPAILGTRGADPTTLLIAGAAAIAVVRSSSFRTLAAESSPAARA